MAHQIVLVIELQTTAIADCHHAAHTRLQPYTRTRTDRMQAGSTFNDRKCAIPHHVAPLGPMEAQWIHVSHAFWGQAFLYTRILHAWFAFVSLRWAPDLGLSRPHMHVHGLF